MATDLSIPVDCIFYKVVIDTYVSQLELKNTTVIKHLKTLKHKSIIKEIDNKLQKITFKAEFYDDESHIFNTLLDNSSVTIDELIESLGKAVEFFTDYEVSRKTQNTIDKYISSMGRYDQTWHNITTKLDYNLSLFRSRTLPYFNLECKDWIKANLDSKKGDYPVEIIGIVNHAIEFLGDKKIKPNGEPDHVNDYHDELNLASKNNNFMEWEILPVDKYPNMAKLTKRIKTLDTIGLKRQALMMFLKLLLSPRECHIIKETSMWDIFKPQMLDKNIEEIIRYCCNYAMYILRQEETIMFSQVKSKYRVLFSLEQAVNMPTFYQAHMERDPYILQLTDDSRLSESMPFYLRGSRKINDYTEFQRRFDIATGGAFKGVNLRSIGAAITGSILIPCVHTSPLEKGFEDVDWNRERNGIKTPYPFMIDTPETAEDYAFANYLEYYYPSYVSLTDEDYTKQVLKDHEKDTVSELTKDEIKYDVDDVDLKSTPVLNIADQSVEQKVDQQLDKKVDKGLELLVENRSIKPIVQYNQLADIDISITTRDHDTFKQHAIYLFEAIKKNCEHRGTVYIKEIRTLASVKYKIYGPGIPRPMDIFRIPYDPAKMVKKFHVHAVKMYYDGDVTLFRSCVSCLLSGVGENYKWFSCSKIPLDVLLKYAQRGFSIILNKKERDACTKYLEQDDRWGAMLKHLGIQADKIYCCVTADHPFFKPGLYGSGIRMTLRNFERDTNGQYANSLVVTHSKSLMPYGDLQFKTNRKYYPPNHNLLSACLDYVDSSDAIEEDD